MDNRKLWSLVAAGVVMAVGAACGSGGGGESPVIENGAVEEDSAEQSVYGYCVEQYSALYERMPEIAQDPEAECGSTDGLTKQMVDELVDWAEEQFG